MGSNYTVFHLHTYYSNANGYADSCTGIKDYVKLAKKQGMKALAFSEHGNVYDWIKKKQECDKAGIKYIHGVELYLCYELSNDDRGSHIGLYAKNWDGVLELNRLVSVSTSKGVLSDKSDRHMYYNPRISLDELMNTSDNIIITSACLASPLNKWGADDNQKKLDTLVRWMTKNKHRCFLEVQYHNCKNQIAYNQKLYLYSKKTGIPLIAGTDTHSSNNYKAECRKILQIYKKSFYGEEDEFDLTWKSYEELVEAFEEQHALPKDVYLEAIKNTNVLADMVESFELNKAFKYPTLYGDDARGQWKELIYSCFNNKLKNKQLKLPSKIKEDCKAFFNTHTTPPVDESEREIYETYQKEYEWAKTHTDKQIIKLYQSKIIDEFNVMCKLGMESFMMFMSELITWANENNIPCGTGRGSVCGSVIAYVTNITDVDPILWGTVFSRFCNEDRISLGDIDVDFDGKDRKKVYQYIIDRFTPEKTAYIATFGTLKDRGCIDALAGGLGYKDLNKVMEIKNRFDEYYSGYVKIIQAEVNTEELVENGEVESNSITFDYHKTYMLHISKDKPRKKLDEIKQQYDALINENQDLFYYLDGLKGTIFAKGVHASGIIGSPITLADNMGVWYKDGDVNTPVSMCAMKSVDSLNYVKFDILGLKTVGLIKDVCEYAQIPYPKSYNINWNDCNTWKNMIEAQQGVFQFESDFSFSLLKDFKPTTINHMSMVNAALRPSGKSYRDKMIAKEKNVNPSKEIDDLLESNNGYLIFQEDTIKFLTDICGFTGSAADTTRRAIGKKDKELLSQQLPKILEGYCNHSQKERHIAEEEAKQFVQIIQDSSEYQFGLNHSTAYSMNGYICVWLRTYYTLEFVAAYLNRAENNEDINYGVELAKQYNIKINPIKFGKSSAEYTIDKKNNAIYKGISSIKFCNKQIAEELLLLSQERVYSSFLELLDDIKAKTSVNTRQLRILTALGYFSDFGKSKTLLLIIDLYDGIKARDAQSKKDIVLLPSLRTCKQIKKEKLSEYEKYGVTEEILRKYSKETDKQFGQIDNIGLLSEMIDRLPDKSMSVQEYVRFEQEYLGYITYFNPNINERYYIVTDFKTFKDTAKPYLTLRQLQTGNEIKTRIKKGSVFKNRPFEKLSVLSVDGFTYDFKKKLVNEEWINTDETEAILVDYEVIK